MIKRVRKRLYCKEVSISAGNSGAPLRCHRRADSQRRAWRLMSAVASRRQKSTGLLWLRGTAEVMLSWVGPC